MSEHGRPPDHGKRIGAARALMAWELGSPSWADRVMYAYENPDESNAALDAEKNELPDRGES